MTPRISDAELISDLQRVADAIGELPTVRQFRERGEYNESTLRKRFGSWSEALEAAKLDGDDARRPIPKSELIKEIQALAAELGEPPTTVQMNAEGERWASVYQRRFGSWNAALEAAGFDPRDQGSSTSRPVSDAELKKELQDLTNRLGHRPTLAEMNTHGEYAASTYKKRFGSWTDALEVVGIDPSTDTNSYSIY